MPPSDSPVEDPLTLVHCPALRRLEFLIAYPAKTQRAVISSVTSANFRTVLFLPDPKSDGLDVLGSHGVRRCLDNLMCGLVDKLRTLGHKHTLELEFRFESAKLDPDLDFRRFLPMFREKGRVRISNKLSGEVLDLVVRISFRGLYQVETSDLAP